MDVKLCRLCANKKDSFVGIYDEEGHKLRIESKISKCLQIEMYPEDPLPKMVCLDCCSKLEQSYRFLETSHVAQMTLHRLFPVGDEGCQTSDLKEEETLVELLPLPAPTDQSLSHQEINDVSDDIEEKVEDDGLEEDIEEEEDEEEDDEEGDEEDSVTQDSLEEVIEEAVEIDNDENEPATGVKRKRQPGRRQKKVEELSELEVEELMHKDKHWQQYSWICSDCSQEFSSVQELREHYQMVHKQSPRYTCAQCFKVNTEFQVFFSHIKRHRNLLKYSCEECGKSFSNKRVLDSHSASHSNVRPYVCQECGKAFRQQNALFIHARCHLPEDIKNKYLCDQCNKRFSTKPNLVTHKRIHTGVRNFTCDQCGKSFIQKGNLDAHMLTHSQDKPFTCELCNKGFKTSMQLRKHHSVHTGAKPHQCEVCGRSFRERGTLREHLRIHTGAMPFTCEYCGKTFRFKGILTTHRRQHTGERPYSCLECQHHFTNWPNYNKHMKRRHGINTSRQTRVKPPAPNNPPPPLEPLPLYEDYPPAPLPPPTTYHPHPNTFTAPGLQQFFTFTQLPGQTHLDPSLDMMQHR